MARAKSFRIKPTKPAKVAPPYSKRARKKRTHKAKKHGHKRATFADSAKVWGWVLFSFVCLFALKKMGL
jgi:hypothetical protein